MMIVNGFYAKLFIFFVVSAYYSNWVVESKDENPKSAKEKGGKPNKDIDPGNSTAIQECSTKWAQKFPPVKKRFSDTVLKEHCKHGAKWVKQAKAPPQKKPLLSDAQLTWLMGVWKCKDLLCICRSVPLCNKFLSQLESGFDKLKGLSDGLNSKFNDLNSFFKNASTNTKGRFKRQTQQQINDVIQGKVGRATRKEIRMLNNEEKAAFFRGINKLKQEKIGDKNKYDILVIYHTPEQSPEAHFCAAFFPFHRELLKNIEVAMRELEPMAALPFWDPTLDQPLPNPADSMIWTDEFLGNGDGPVTVGPFASWMTLPDSQVEQFANSMKITRALGKSQYGSLLKDSDIETILNKNSFRELAYCNDPFAELIHGTTHMWVGGHMVELRTSPNDPTFFLYHNYLDSVWEQWRQQKQSRAQRETDYTSDNESCNTFCYGSAPMKPFPIKNSDGLLNSYTDELYSFEPKPNCNTKNCGSPYLFCDSRTTKCVGKVKVNGNCTGFESEDVCYKSRCRSGRCVLDDAAGTTLAPTFPPSTPGVVTVPFVFITAPNAPTTTTTATLPPTLVTMPPTSSTVKTVWLPITVVNQVGKESKAYPDAAIISTDMVHAVKFSGVVSDPTKAPYYTGASFAQLLNPFTVPDGVQATIQVFDDNMQECTSMCLNTKTQLYEPCVAKVSISSNILSSQDIAYSPDFEQARILNWKGNKRIPDKFLFMCHAPDTSTTMPIEIITKPPDSASTAATVPPTTTVPSNVVIKNQTGGLSVDITSNTDLTAKIMNGGCRNLHRCCIIWSGVGECKRNPWMQLSCQMDCGVCQDGTDLSAAGCIDYHTDCQKWANDKQCNKNPNWMQENCKKSCGVCNRKLSQLLVLCGASGGAENCVDTDDKCKTWANEKECEMNPWWMKENCAVSCNSCKKKTNVFIF